ncbi:MAG: hypothetical protein LM590_14090, partial [Thermofilum sp.]|nr:hypothetical protein [Thermofilum sp.]
GSLAPERVVEYYGDGSWLGLRLTYVYQGYPYGIAHAVYAVREVVPDCVIQYVEPPYQQQVSYGLIDAKIRSLGYRPQGSLKLGVEEVVDKFRALLRGRLAGSAERRP